MKHPHTIVYFYPHNARLFKVLDPTEYLDLPNVAVNPDLARVHALPPHHWKLEGGFVVPKTEEERAEVDAWHNENIQKNPEVITVTKVEEKLVEKIVEKLVEVPVDRVVERLIEVEKLVEVPIERLVEVLVEVPVEKIVEVKVPYEVLVEVEKIVIEKIYGPWGYFTNAVLCGIIILLLWRMK